MPNHPASLKRILGVPTVWLIGMGVAIGSGIFRTPGEIASRVPSPAAMLLVWVAAAAIVLAQGMVTAELATRFPRAGGEYVYLREAYGRFVAFFFGWSYTVFIIGGGAAAIAVALGDFACRLWGLPGGAWAGPIAAGAVLAVTCVNACGLRIGAGAQNALTVLKCLALVALIVIGLGWGREPIHWFGAPSAPPGEPRASARAETPELIASAPASEPRASARAETPELIASAPASEPRTSARAEPPSVEGIQVEEPHAPESSVPSSPQSLGIPAAFAAIAAFLSALLPALWAYDGTTDSVKMAEEVRDVRRAMPRAIVGATLSLAVLYVLVNYALLRMLPMSEFHDEVSVPGRAMEKLFGQAGRRAMLIAAIVVCLGSLSATVLATIRVTFALARDGLTFRFLGRMSAGQSPVAALFVVCGFSIVLCLIRDFGGVLNIYYFAGCILFGLSYASLLVFRRRDAKRQRDGSTHDAAGARAEIFRCPAGRGIAVFLVTFQLILAANIVSQAPRDAAWACGVLATVGALYLVWKRAATADRGPHNGTV